jgi:hypothetical protein
MSYFHYISIGDMYDCQSLMPSTFPIVTQKCYYIRESAEMARFPQWIGVHFIINFLPVCLYVID